MVQNCANCEYHVDGIFIWNDASWDIQAIYPESTTSEGTYRCKLLNFYMSPRVIDKSLHLSERLAYSEKTQIAVLI